MARGFGYDDTKERTIVEDEATHIIDAIRRVVAGESLRSITAEWNDKQILTTQGYYWRPAGLLRMLRSPIHADKGLVPRETYDAMIAIFNDPQRITNQTFKVAHLLTGHLSRCALCGHALVSKPSDSKLPTYMCPSPYNGGCGGIRISSEPLNAYVRDAAFNRITDPDVQAQLLAHAQTDTFDARLAAIAARVAQAADDYLNGHLPHEGWLALTQAQAALTRVADAERERLAALQTLPEATADGLETWWDNNSLERRRELLTTVIDYVAVGPSHGRAGHKRNTIDPNRVVISWREYTANP